MPDPQIDYAALAKQFGGTATVDYDALAAAQGGSADAPTFSVQNEKDAQGNAVVDPNTVGTVLRHFWNGVNPVQLGQLLPFPKAAGGSGLDNPLLPSNIVKQMHAVKLEGDAAWAKGDKVTAAAKYAESFLPLLGPWMSQQGDQLQQGRYMASLGDTAAFATNLAAPELAHAATTALTDSKLADAAEASAREKTAQIMSPTGSSREIRQLGKQAATVAPDVLRGTSAVTPESLATQVAGRLEQSGDALDAAYGALPKTGYATGALRARLEQSLRQLQVSGSNGAITSAAVADRAGSLQQAMQELDALGPYTNTDNLVKLRNQWKEAAKSAFVPEVNPNALQLRAAGKGWADAWGATQDFLTDRYPQLKPLNADYRVWKQASDVMEALADRERVRPTVGRSIMAAGVGAMAGGAAGGELGATIGSMVGPLVERGLVSTLGPAMKLTAARQLQSLADALRTGNLPKASMLVRTLRPLLTTATVTAQTPASPTLAAATP